ncbi:hypothetical protein O9929_23695 [Vibrio lentus]|nr:hypothetical protein [Vibrio lentus]
MSNLKLLMYCCRFSCQYLSRPKPIRSERSGLNTFENYPLSKQRRFFTSREQLNQLLQMRDIQRQYSEGDRKYPEYLEHLFTIDSLLNRNTKA